MKNYMKASVLLATGTLLAASLLTACAPMDAFKPEKKEDEVGIHVLTYFKVLLGHWWIIVPCVVLGAALGFVLQVAFAVPLIAAEQIAGTMGLAIATSIDPASGQQSGALGSFFGLILTLLFYVIGGHLLWFRLIMESYRLLPAGSGAFGSVEAQSIVLFAGYCIATAAAIALPVILVLLCVQLITGTISRAAPALNLFALGLPAGTLAGITAMIVAMPILIEQFTLLLQAALEQSAAIFTPGLGGVGG